MNKSIQKIPPNKPPSLDKLAQLPTKQPKTSKSLQKRARSKWYTQGIVGGLMYLKTPLRKYYQRAYYCNNLIIQEGETLRSTYCNTRICNVCNRIRTAKMMNGYISQLEGRELWFVTLTVPNVNADELRSTIKRIQSEVVKMMRVFRERRGIRFNGIRKIEVTYNQYTKTYHPHVHLLVDSPGQCLVNEWLKRNPTANRIAQDCRRADEGSLHELFKYATKVIGHKEEKLIVYVKALDIIITSLFGLRSFQPFGDIRKVTEDVDDSLKKEIYENIPVYDFMNWTWNECDWVSENKETLTGYISPEYDFSYR